MTPCTILRILNPPQAKMQLQAVLVSALVAAVAAQSSIGGLVAQIPSCALGCIATAAESQGCSITDYQCQCGKASAIQLDAQPCIQAGCSAADQASEFDAADGFYCRPVIYTPGGSITNSYLPAQPP
ncbi:MAG: CFEM domain-containing protein [Thaumarchaeota archaeon]|nr:CFEM domain-containing protein [Nitrososphaerota archaeon]